MKKIFTISKSMHWAPITPQSRTLECIRWFNHFVFFFVKSAPKYSSKLASRMIFFYGQFVLINPGGLAIAINEEVALNLTHEIR